MKPKIYVTGYAIGDGVEGVALAEDGAIVATHVSASFGWMKHDMGLFGTRKHDLYDKHYPAGWDLEYVAPESREGHAGWNEAVARNAARGGAAI